MLFLAFNTTQCKSINKYKLVYFISSTDSNFTVITIRWQCMECQHLTRINYSLPRILTRVVLPSLCHLSASERLSYLRWLPVHYQIQFKIAILTYKTLATCQPSYLYNLLQLHQPSRALRSSTRKLLQIPYMSIEFGQCAFSYNSPATWNSIPTSINNCASQYSFKRHLKSHLIAQLINNQLTPSGHLVTC